MALLLIDIDHFKQLNDTFGHHHGDLCLGQVARELAQAASRGSDVVARYGGDEFAALLSSVTFRQACDITETMRASVHRLQLAAVGDERVTVSIGGGVRATDR